MSGYHESIQPIHTEFSTEFTAQARALALHCAIAGAHITPHQLQLWAPEGAPAMQAYIEAALCHPLSKALQERMSNFVALYDRMMADISATIAQEEEEGYEEAL